MILTMTEIKVTEFSRNLKSILNRVERNHEEIVLIRNQEKIARIIPGSPCLNAMQAMADLYKTLPEEAAKDWIKDSRMKGNLRKELRNPWDT